MTGDGQNGTGLAETMLAVRLRTPRGVEGLALEEIETPSVQPGEALVRVHAAAITRDELDWPVDRLPAIPSYELSGVVAAVAPDVTAVSVGESVYALTGFDRDGVAAEYAVVPAGALAPKPTAVDHVECAAIPLAALSAWQGLFARGGLEAGQRVLVLGAAGGVGHFATQLARLHGAYVIGMSSSARVEDVRSRGAHEAIGYEEAVGQVDLVFDTVGGDVLVRSLAVVREGGRVVSVAEEPPESNIETMYFVVEPRREQLVEVAELVDRGDLRPTIDSVFPLADARAAFERSMATGKSGKVVLRVDDE